MHPTAKTILLLLLTCPAFSQKLERYYDYRGKETDIKYARFYSMIEKTDSGWHRKDFFMRGLSLHMDGWYEDSACKKASGPFIYAYPNKMVQSRGRYLAGKKQGLWLTYYPDGFMTDSVIYNNGKPTGTRIRWHRNSYTSDSSVYQPDGSGVEVAWFDNGNPSSAGMLAAGFKQQGRWKYFHKNGQVSAVELYENGKLMEKQYFGEDGSSTTDTANNDRAAEFPGGMKAWGNYLVRHLYFPTQYKLVNSDKAVVVISAIIDENGKVEDAYVDTPFYPEFDKIALDAVRNSPKWLPARNHNRNIKYYIKQPVAFSQQE